jgi:hypothetical protein
MAEEVRTFRPRVRGREVGNPARPTAPAGATGWCDGLTGIRAARRANAGCWPPGTMKALSLREAGSALPRHRRRKSSDGLLRSAEASFAMVAATRPLCDRSRPGVPRRGAQAAFTRRGRARIERLKRSAIRALPSMVTFRGRNRLGNALVECVCTRAGLAAPANDRCPSGWPTAVDPQQSCIGLSFAPRSGHSNVR